VSETPIRLGTTYVDRSKQGPLHGRVTAYQPPHELGFHQEAQLALGRLAIDIRYQLEELEGVTRVHRTTAPQMSGMLALLRPIVIRSIRRENLRTLARIKQYLETPPP
jgi:carbon monoxide dehydrogenase subunit G